MNKLLLSILILIVFPLEILLIIITLTVYLVFANGVEGTLTSKLIDKL